MKRIGQLYLWKKGVQEVNRSLLINEDSIDSDKLLSIAKAMFSIIEQTSQSSQKNGDPAYQDGSSSLKMGTRVWLVRSNAKQVNAKASSL